MFLFGELLTLALLLTLCSSTSLDNINMTDIFTDDPLYIPSTADLIDFEKLKLYNQTSWYK